MEGRDFEMGDEAELLKVPCLKKKNHKAAEEILRQRERREVRRRKKKNREAQSLNPP